MQSVNNGYGQRSGSVDSSWPPSLGPRWITIESLMATSPFCIFVAIAFMGRHECTWDFLSRSVDT